MIVNGVTNTGCFDNLSKKLLAVTRCRLENGHGSLKIDFTKIICGFYAFWNSERKAMDSRPVGRLGTKL